MSAVIAPAQTLHVEAVNYYSAMVPMAKKGKFVSLKMSDGAVYKNCIQGIPEEFAETYAKALVEGGYSKEHVNVTKGGVVLYSTDKTTLLSFSTFPNGEKNTIAPEGYECAYCHIDSISASEDKDGNSCSSSAWRVVWKPTTTSAIVYNTGKTDEYGSAETKEVELAGRKFLTDIALDGDFESEKIGEDKYLTTYIGEGTNFSLPSGQKGIGKIQKGWSYNEETNTFTSVYEETGLGVIEKEDAYECHFSISKGNYDIPLKLKVDNGGSVTYAKDEIVLTVPKGNGTYTIEGENYYVGTIVVNFKNGVGTVERKYGLIDGNVEFYSPTVNVKPKLDNFTCDRNTLLVDLKFENKDNVDLSKARVKVYLVGDMVGSGVGAIIGSAGELPILAKDGDLMAETSVNENVAHFGVRVADQFATHKYRVEIEGLPKGYKVDPFTFEYIHSEDKLTHFVSVNENTETKVQCGFGSTVNAGMKPVEIAVPIINDEKPTEPSKPEEQPKPKPVEPVEPQEPAKPQPQEPQKSEKQPETKKEQVGKGMPTGVQTSIVPLVIAGVVVAGGVVAGGYKLYKKRKNK